MNMISNQANKDMQMRFVAGELQGFRKIISFLWDENPEAFAALYFVKANYKEWPEMLKWMKQNNLKGQALADFFKNESPDGGGYHMGATYILSRLKGLKHGTQTIKIDELIGG